MTRVPMLPRKVAQALAIAAAVTAVVGTGPAFAGTSHAQQSLAKTAREQVSPERMGPLLNGDRIAIVAGPSGQPTVAILGTTPGIGGALLNFSVGGASYEVPADALPYLGRGLDPSLFDVADLAAHYADGTLLVTVTYHGTRPDLPGMMVTKAAAGSVSGYLTAASARTFGAALLRQYLADHARDSYGTDGLFANGLTISLSGASRTPGARASTPTGPYVPAKPGFVMHTLTVHGTNLAGKPDTGDVVAIINADNANRFGAGISFFTASLNSFYHGVAKYSLPAGHYWALGTFLDAKKPTIGTAERLSILSQFTVSGNTSVHISERTATSELTMTTPRPSVLVETTLQLVRTGAAGPPIGVTAFALPGYPLFISPVSKRPTVGTLATYTSGQLASPVGAKQPYFYNIAYEDRSGLVHSQRFTVSPKSLATVTARYYADAPSTGAAMPLGYYLGQPNPGGAFAVYMPIPEQRTEYFTAGAPPVTWFDEFFQYAGTLDTGQTDSGRTFRPGEAITEDWNEYPLHTTTNVNTVGARTQQPVLVSASRAGDTLTLDLSPFADNDPGHNAAGYVSVFDGSQSPTSGAYEVDENGTKIAAGNPVKSLGETGGDFFAHVKLARGAGTIRVVLDATRTGKLYTLSTTTQTAWTWHSAPAVSGTVPAGWACDWSLSTGPTGRDCTPQPLLTLNYNVAGLDLTGTAPAGPQTVTLNVGHMALTTGGKITGVTAQVSFDDGSTWQPATMTGGNGSYQAAFTAPASSDVTLKVAASDAAGGRIAETITRAYATASAPAPPTARAAASGRLRPACPPAPSGQMRCFTLYAPQPAVNRAMADGAVTTPVGWGARAIESAYRLPTSKNPHQTVAVVDAFDTPNLGSYLNTYRKRYGLPACTTASGCLRIVNQKGAAKPLPQSGVPFGWALETAVDVEMVSAACPACHILVVEANSPSDVDLAAAENTAARLGAPVISNSYGSRESGFSMPYAGAYDHLGHTVVVSSGDFGFGAANFPAVLGTVTAVGATELAKAPTARGWTERVWNDAGGASASGCSAYIAKPAWQHDAYCSMRTAADVSAVGWNVAIYSKDYGGWVTAAGTSISAPLIAGVYGLAGNAANIKPGYEYAHMRWLYDVTSGNNDLVTGTGAQCGGDYLCVAKKGYDAPTGLGTPDGTGAF
jgi:hypothetical protein